MRAGQLDKGFFERTHTGLQLGVLDTVLFEAVVLLDGGLRLEVLHLLLDSYHHIVPQFFFLRLGHLEVLQILPDLKELVAQLR